MQGDTAAAMPGGGGRVHGEEVGQGGRQSDEWCTVPGGYELANFHYENQQIQRMSLSAQSRTASRSVVQVHSILQFVF